MNLMENFKIDIPAEKVDERTIKELKAEGLPIVIFGAGDVADTFKKKLNAAGITDVYFAVSRGFTKSEGVFSPDELDAKLSEYNLIPGFRSAVEGGTFSDKDNLFHNKKRIAFLRNPYEGKGVDELTAEFFREHYEDYKKLYDSLADEKSRESYRAFLYGKLSEDYSRIAALVERPAYFSGDFLHFGKEEVFVDCGAYDGDSIRDFEKYVIQRRVGGGQDLCI